jgi:hypothetical protein
MGKTFVKFTRNVHLMLERFSTNETVTLCGKSPQNFNKWEGLDSVQRALDKELDSKRLDQGFARESVYCSECVDEIRMAWDQAAAVDAALTPLTTAREPTSISSTVDDHHGEHNA